MYSYVLFDLDGTLTDSKEGICKSVQYALHEMGIEEPDIDKLESYIGPPLEYSFAQYHKLSGEKVKEAIAAYRVRFRDVGILENKVYPGIPELLRHCTECGIVLALASSKPEVFVKRILEQFSLAPYFRVVVGSELDGTRGEKEEVVEEALRQLHEIKNEALTRENTAMVGDRKFDIQGAKLNGITGIGVGYGYAPEGELEAEGADLVAATVEDLERLLTGDSVHGA